MAYVIAGLIGYLLGCSNMARYVAYFKNVDIMHNGSCNPGTANTVVVIGWWAGILVGAHDIGKSVLAGLIAWLLFPQVEGVAAVAAAACVIGHIYPVFTKFVGGKGFAPYIGMMLLLDWRFGLVILALVVLATILTDYIVVGTTITVLGLPVYLLIFFAGWITIVPVVLTTLVIIWKHRQNYVRIVKGTEIGLRSTAKKEHRVK